MKSINIYFVNTVVAGLLFLAACAPASTLTQQAATVTTYQPETALPQIQLSPTPEIVSDTLDDNEPVVNPLALPPADEASARLSLPEGFAIRIFADGLQGRPRFMAFGPDGSLYVSLISAGQVMRLPDRDKDGLADGQEIVLNGLNQPHGLEWYDGWLYVAENDRVERFSSSAGNGVFDKRELVTDNIPGGGGHISRTLHFGPDDKLYVSAGSTCNVCEESDPRRAAILRFNADGTIPADNPFAADPDPRRQAVWAWGLRNSVDFLWTASGQMWANVNGRDNLLDTSGLPDNLPPEVIVYPISGGSYYGWPYCYFPVLGADDGTTAQVLDTQSGLRLPEGLDCSQAVPALFSDLAHSAPLGMSFAGGGNFPAEYQQDLYVAYHGSWNVQNPASIRDCKVVRVVIENGKPVRSEDFVNGFRTAGGTCGDGSAYGRPADVVFGPDGAMYISDDAGGRVYRVISVN